MPLQQCFQPLFIDIILPAVQAKIIIKIPGNDPVQIVIGQACIAAGTQQAQQQGGNGSFYAAQVHDISMLPACAIIKGKRSAPTWLHHNTLSYEMMK